MGTGGNPSEPTQVWPWVQPNRLRSCSTSSSAIASSATLCQMPVYERVRHHFTEAELVNLRLAVVAINGWNRFAIAFRAVPGTYQPHKKTTY